MKHIITNNKVGISRDIIRGNWGLTLREKRLLMLAISKVDYRTSTDLNEKKEWGSDRIGDDQVVITVDDYQQITGTDTTHHDAARDLVTAIRSLKKKSLTIQIDANRTKTINYTAAIDYYAAEKIVILTFHALFWPYLINLRRYVGYQLKQVKNLSAGAWRLFEVLLSYPPSGASIELSELKFSLGCEKKANSDFLKRNIRPAITEINKHTSSNVFMRQKKSGRTITSIYFSRSESKRGK